MQPLSEKNDSPQSNISPCLPEKGGEDIDTMQTTIPPYLAEKIVEDIATILRSYCPQSGTGLLPISMACQFLRFLSFSEHS